MERGLTLARGGTKITSGHWSPGRTPKHNIGCRRVAVCCSRSALICLSKSLQSGWDKIGWKVTVLVFHAPTKLRCLHSPRSVMQEVQQQLWKRYKTSLPLCCPSTAKQKCCVTGGWPLRRNSWLSTTSPAAHEMWKMNGNILKNLLYWVCARCKRSTHVIF